MRQARLKGIQASSSGSSVCLREATTIASSSSDSTVDRASFGPVGRSATDVRRFHLAIVFWLIPYRFARDFRLA